jgi:hypothetical protein
MKTWSSEEVETLCTKGHAGMKVLMALIPNKSAGSIFTKASNLGVAIARVLEYDRNGSELDNKRWAWTNRILPELKKKGECMEWHGSHSKGYGQIRIFAAGEKRIFSTHRIALEVARGALIEDNLSALHRCDNPRCNNPDHLFTGTIADNVHDMHSKSRAKGMFVKGQKPHENQTKGTEKANAVLTEEKVMEARVIHAAGLLGYKLLAKRYGATHQIIRRVILRKGWLHVPEATPEQRHAILSEYLKLNPAKPKRYGKEICL